ncbi:MAG: CvpA family protein [Clostridia bacterium]|nr:CvpA family protein [Clostridia bacterium]
MYIYTTLFIVEALMVLTGFLLGLKRGAGKAIVRFVELIIAAIFSFLVTKWLSGLLSDISIQTIKFEEPLGSIIESAPIAKELVAGLAIALVLPIIFAVIFLVIKSISLIGLSLLTRLLFGGKGGGLSNRLIGGAIGALTSLVVAVIVLCPFYTGAKILANIPSETYDAFTSSLGMNEQDTALFKSFFPEKDMTPPVSGLVVKAATNFSVEDKSYNATEEAPKLIDLAGDIMVSYGESKDAGESELMCISAAISASVAHLEDSEYVASLTTSLLNSIGESIKNGNDIFGLANGMEGPLADVILKSVGNILTGVTPENIAANISAIAGDGENEGALTVLAEITSAEDIKEVLKDGEQVDKLANSLIAIAKNPELSSTMDSLTEMGASVFTEAMPEEGSDERDEYIGKLSESVNDVLAATKETQSDFEGSVNTATVIIQEKIAAESSTEITEGEAKLLAIYALHHFGTTENYADAENAPVSVEDIEALFGLNK